MNRQEIAFGAGCFWCIEACFTELKGVLEVESGYSGGNIKNPAYREVCSGRTGHAEVVRVVYDENMVSLDTLLEVFWSIHNPTTLNRQGADVGTQYRSAIFYQNSAQKETADSYKEKLDKSGSFEDPIVTEITEWTNFYPAGEDHAQYLANNPEVPYCQMVVKPKFEKFKKVFADKLA